MTLQELRDELHRTQAAWEAELDPDGFLTSRQLPVLSQEAHRQQGFSVQVSLLNAAGAREPPE